jgi:hypothetical protein
LRKYKKKTNKYGDSWRLHTKTLISTSTSLPSALPHFATTELFFPQRRSSRVFSNTEIS